MAASIRISRPVALLCVAVALTAAGVIIAIALGPSSPDAGLSDPERHALYSKLRQEGVEQHKAFVADFVAKGEDPRKLEQIPLGAAYGSEVPLPSLEFAVAKADLIVIGEVEKNEYQFDAEGYLSTSVTVRVSGQLKGNEASLVTIRQTGGPNFSESEDHPYLMTLEGDPPLFVGDNAVLFLTAADNGIFETEPFVGQYRVEGGAISADEENPFAQSVDGMSVEAFTAAVRTFSR